MVLVIIIFVALVVGWHIYESLAASYHLTDPSLPVPADFLKTGESSQPRLSTVSCEVEAKKRVITSTTAIELGQHHAGC